MVVLRLLAHRERARHRHADRPRRQRAQEVRFADVHGMRAPNRAHHARHGVRMTRPVERRPRVVEVEPLERVGEVVRVALAPDLAVGDDVDAGLLHVAHGERRRVVLGLLEPLVLDAPQLVGGYARRQPSRELRTVDQPVGLRIAADDGGLERRHRDKIRGGGGDRGRSRSQSHLPGLSGPGRGPGTRPRRRPDGQPDASRSTSTCCSRAASRPRSSASSSICCWSRSPSTG